MSILRSLWAWMTSKFDSLEKPEQALIQLIIGALVGSGVIVTLNRYALYYYAYSEGFRLPLEGVAYLDLAVSLVYFSILAASVIVGFLISRIVKLLEGKRISVAIVRFSLVLAPLLGLVGTVVGGIATFRSIALFGQGDPEIMARGVSVSLWITVSGLILALLTFVLPVLVEVGTVAISWLRIIATILIFAIVTVFMFQKTVYAEFLRTIRFGGEIPVTAYYRSGDDTAAESSGLLMISTTLGIILRSHCTSEFIEIPRSRISALSYTHNKFDCESSQSDDFLGPPF